MNAELADKILAFVQVAGHLANRAEALEQEKQASDKLVREMIPTVLTMLKEAQAVPPHLEQEVVRKMATHAGALELLGSAGRLMQTRQQKQAQVAATRMGEGYDPRPSQRPRLHVCGQRTVEKQAAWDEALEKLLDDPR